ncbi:holo-ACP synthase [Thalassomonas sp. M1454]|uniref:holo-ACP synthase n=1 Tax=Thalassomonas sp. M1454 TaxID=2594477 RepID=UPI00117EB30D|nr:holo-ACP synthase [Thalassomonas sp. M1454]TRX55830.1 holo-ACP synthase [Thalassomonas sp. M1454]
MSVVGIGNDIVEIGRIKAMAEKARERLAIRVLTELEYQTYQNSKQAVSFLAKRWAGKEAAAKALGRGIADGISFQHFEISNLESGQPILTLTGRALEIAKQMQAQHFHISLSDEKEYALAFVVLSR